jgi:hypothetical protein
MAKEGKSMTLTIRIDAQRATLTQTISSQGTTATITLQGDYSVSRDYVLYGFVTGIDVSEELGDPDQVSKMAALALDQTFAIRYRVDENSLTIRDIKAGGVDDKNRADLQVLAGRYKKKAGGKEEKW